MKRLNKAIYFISGMLTALLLVSMITPALAAGLSKYIEVSTGVSVYVDDVKLDPRDANGNPVEIFIYNGTTYLPVRAVSEALEIPVQWEGSARSVYVGKHTGNKPVAWLANMDYFSGTPDNDCYILDSGLHQKNPLKPQGFGGFSDDGGEMFPLFYPYCAVSLNRRQHS